MKAPTQKIVTSNIQGAPHEDTLLQRPLRTSAVAHSARGFIEL